MPIPPPLHAVLDGLSAAALIAAPWPARVRRPMRALGAGVAAYSLATAYVADQRRPIPMRRHLAIDALQGAGVLLAAATMRDLDRRARLAMAAYGVVSLAAATLTDSRPAPSTRQIALPPGAVTGRRKAGGPRAVAPDVACQRLGIVNVVFLGTPGRWVLVDAGLRGTAGLIVAAAERRFGPGARPQAILLTHGHFDHVGALRALAERWDVPIYAHPQEFPYLTGWNRYPPARPERGGGLMAALSPLYPTQAIDVSDRLRALPPDGRVPGAPGWVWLHTPGHSPGHVSLWDEARRILISGDAVITTRQESATAVALQTAELHGPPAYFTPDWDEAAETIRRLADLGPQVIVPGHGRPVRAAWLARRLDMLARLQARIGRGTNGRTVAEHAA